MRSCGIIGPMLVEHDGCSPTIDPSAYVAPTATLSGDVRVGPGCRVRSCGIIGPMLVEHDGCSPTIDPSAYVAPTATLSGDVRVGPGCRVLFGAVLTAE